MKLICVTILCIFVVGFVKCRSLESVDDNDLVQLIKNEDNVIALFTKNNCDECDIYEIVLENIQDDLHETLGATVVKAHNSPMVSIYDPSKEPSLLYFRRGIPLLYHGAINEDDILQQFSDNRDPVVKELSDANFEHLTQAATGATTGDWLVFFYSSDCVVCQRLYAIWEAVGASLKRRLNVARINRLESGISTAKRFNVMESPEFLLIRQGKFYRYKSKEYTAKGFIEFVEKLYLKNLKPEDVPPVVSPLNDLFSSTTKLLLNHPNIAMVAAIVLIFALIGMCCTKYAGSSRTKTKKNKKTT